MFEGGFDLAAARHLAAEVGIPSDEALDRLARLVDTSLVVAETTAAPTARYRLLEPLRQYAADRLERRGTRAGLRHQRALWYLALAERWGAELWTLDGPLARNAAGRGFPVHLAG